MKKALILFGIGGGLYFLIELLWRGYSHPAMIVVGGVCFILIGLINEHLTWDMPLLLQGLIATVIVLAIEFGAGCILNLWLKLAIWNYSHLPYNLLGQVQLYFAGAWYVLSIGGIFLDDYLRFRLFGEERPHYRGI